MNGAWAERRPLPTLKAKRKLSEPGAALAREMAGRGTGKAGRGGGRNPGGGRGRAAVGVPAADPHQQQQPRARRKGCMRNLKGMSST